MLNNEYLHLTAVEFLVPTNFQASCCDFSLFFMEMNFEMACGVFSHLDRLFLLSCSSENWKMSIDLVDLQNFLIQYEIFPNRQCHCSILQFFCAAIQFKTVHSSTIIWINMCHVSCAAIRFGTTTVTFWERKTINIDWVLMYFYFWTGVL